MKEGVVGDGFTIQSTRVRGWPCHIYTSYNPPFVTGHAADDDTVQVFVDFYAEFGFDWEQKPDADKLFKRAEQIACELLAGRIETVMQERRKRWRKRR